MHRLRPPLALMLVLLLLSGCTRLGFALRDEDRGPDSAGDGSSRDRTSGDRAPFDHAPSPVDGPTDGRMDGNASDAKGPADAPSWPDLMGTPVTLANDTCATAHGVLLQPAYQVDLVINTAGAANDYGLTCCTGQPDVVIRIDDSAGHLSFTCGEGPIGVAIGDVCAADPACTTCADHWTVGIAIPSPTAYVIVCRDPALGPTTLSLRK